MACGCGGIIKCALCGTDKLSGLEKSKEEVRRMIAEIRRRHEEAYNAEAAPLMRLLLDMEDITPKNYHISVVRDHN